MEHRIFGAVMTLVLSGLVLLLVLVAIRLTHGESSTRKRFAAEGWVRIHNQYVPSSHAATFARIYNAE